MNKRRRATLSGFLLLAALFSAVLIFKFVLWDGLNEREKAIDAYQKQQALAGELENARIAAFKKRILRAVTLPEWEALAKDIKDAAVEQKDKDTLSAVIAAKAFERRALVRDSLLYDARRLLETNE